MDSQIIARKILDQIPAFSINNSPSKLFSTCEVDYWMVNMLWKELYDLFLLCSCKEQLFDVKLFSSSSAFLEPFSSVSSNAFPYGISGIAGISRGYVNWLIFCCCCWLIFPYWCCCWWWCCHNKFQIKYSLSPLGRPKLLPFCWLPFF